MKKHLTRACFALLLLLTMCWAQEGQSGAIVVGDKVLFRLGASVGTYGPDERALIVNRRINEILANKAIDPSELAVRQLGDSYVIHIGDYNILEVTPQDAAIKEVEQDRLALAWTTSLRENLVRTKPLHRVEHREHSSSLVPLLLIAGLAFVVPLLASRLSIVRLPVVVGEILLGMLIGTSGLNLVPPDVTIEFLAEFGFAYLMFLSGLEIDFRLLAEGKKPGQMVLQHPTVLPIAVFLITLVLAGISCIFLMNAGLISNPIMMALLLSTVSLGLVVPMLKQRELTGTLYGQTLLVTALVADFVTMILITVVAGWTASGPTANLFIGLLIFGFFIAAIRITHILQSLPWLRMGLQRMNDATAQIKVRGAIALMLAFVALSETLGTEAILGAFLAGALVALFARSGSEDLKHRMDALGFGFFIPIFFIMVGVRFDISALLRSPQGMALAPILVGLAVVIKVVASLVLKTRFSWKETLAAGLLITPGLSLIIAAAEIGLRLGIFSEATYAAAIFLALVTCVVGPLGFQLLMPKAEGEQAELELMTQH